MDYRMQATMVIDTAAKKDQFRDALLADLEAQYANGNLKSYSMTINGILVESEDSEQYQSE
jgi:hypothetical protein